MTKEKTKAHYGLWVLLFLLLGLGIQFALGYADYRRETGESAALLEELKGEARDRAGEEQNRREALRRESQPRLASLPQLRREAREGEDPSLLTLVNPWNPMAEGYLPELVLVEEKDSRSYELDVRCARAFWSMMADCAEAGALPYVCSAFRTGEDQEKLYLDKIKRLEEEGVPPEEAPGEAARTVAVPGTSEHQLGLAVDIIDESYPYLDEGQEGTPAQIWLMENCWHYGFILRYPNGTSENTGIIYEPWHYRYVGPRYAEEIHRMGVTLEEYLQRREGR